MLNTAQSFQIVRQGESGSQRRRRRRKWTILRQQCESENHCAEAAPTLGGSTTQISEFKHAIEGQQEAETYIDAHYANCAPFITPFFNVLEIFVDATVQGQSSIIILQTNH
jgi:hypothetical protein